MKTIIIASHNPVKIQACLTGFQSIFPQETFEIRSVSVSSGVSDQPISDRETLQGAQNRAENAAEESPEGDYWVGIEGGVEEMGIDLTAFAWIVICSSNQTGKSRTGTFFLPAAITRLVRTGIELGEADDQVFGQHNSKQGMGAIGLLTDNAVNRTALYAHAVTLALVSFKNPSLYAESV
jgi:inosine/xanthosine triphosphatase